jgi:hypothetical protein
MPQVIDWTGVRQGRLYVTRRVGSRQDGQSTWECICECGNRCVKSSGRLRAGVKTCGTACGVAASNRRRVKHAMAKSKEHRAWQAAKQRCFNPKNPQYKNYGARGISMHPDWVESFDAFYRHIGPAPGQGRHVSIDRIENDGNYEPGNVRWVTSVKIQVANRRVSRNIETADGVKNLAEIAETSDLSYATLDSRWRNGLRGEDLLSPKQEPKIYEIDGVAMTLPAWAKERGVKEVTVRGRMQMGDGIEEALDPEMRKTEPYKYKERPERKEKIIKQPRRYFTIGGETLTLRQWCNRLSMPYSTVRYRLRTGLTIEQALNLKAVPRHV